MPQVKIRVMRRRSDNGQLTSEQYVKEHPETTVTEKRILIRVKKVCDHTIRS